jgi:phage tail tape-measure protein
MKIMLRTIGVVLVSMELVLTTGCVNPNGTQNNTGTGALIGGALGALAGAATGGRHAGEHALVGALAGVIAGGLIGNMIDQEQRQRLQQQSPQTWNKLQNNDAVYASSPPPAPPAVASPTPSTPPATTAAPPSIPTATTTPQMQQFTVDDIKALTAAGVRTDAIKQEIEVSKSTFSAQDIAVAQQANVDPAVIECMRRNHSS